MFYCSNYLLLETLITITINVMTTFGANSILFLFDVLTTPYIPLLVLTDLRMKFQKLKLFPCFEEAQTKEEGNRPQVPEREKNNG